ISPDALEVARHNARTNHVKDRITFQETSLMSGIPGPLDLICANLPYIPSEKLHRLPIYLREPTLALDGGEDGLKIIGLLLTQAAEKLAPDGLILLEIESGHPVEAKALAQQHFPQAEVNVHPDLAGHARIVSIQAL
ncbi:MAG: hypothetical protein P8046_10155, partial [Anaerolineales bacterium]